MGFTIQGLGRKKT